MKIRRKASCLLCSALLIGFSIFLEGCTRDDGSLRTESSGHGSHRHHRHRHETTTTAEPTQTATCCGTDACRPECCNTCAPPVPKKITSCQCDDTDRRRSSRSKVKNCFGCAFAVHARRRHFGGELLETCQTTCSLEIGCDPAGCQATTTAETETTTTEEETTTAVEEVTTTPCPSPSTEPPACGEPPSPPCPPALQERDCTPMCHWKCEEQTCPQTCKPKCQPAKCSTRCKGLNTESCHMVCGEPTCRTECPEKLCGCDGSSKEPCPLKSCPQCETKCDPPQCEMQCGQDQQDCRHVCAQPVCDWVCSEPEKCEKPKCTMHCDKPRNCLDNGHFIGMPPPLENGEFEVKSFDAPASLLQFADASKIRVNVTYRGEDGNVKYNNVHMLVELDQAISSMKVKQQRQLRSTLQGHLQA